MRNCRPHQLALIVQDEPELGAANVGQLVLVLPEFLIEPEGLYWRIRSLGREMPWIEFETGYFGGYDMECFHRDAWLRPLRGAPARDAALRDLRLPVLLESLS